ncbi:hypothetical protein C8046_04725 [Serinibacter arcticus]|uniref:DUF3137 domain-containing protein n=1 Tax=Serinibacter arcticus TaxID=1655435 RepID=A0A2U1ZSW0_9MICO|nr:hypothetical protein [Serinibacter arcticus]PWD50075.1 hypothetical protein C8046_04725 [Serinibacter arcticus]
MESMFLLVPVMFVAVPLLMIGLVVYAVVSSKRRREGLTAYAGSRGFTFRPDGDHLVDRFPGDPFGRGYRRSGSQVVEGVHEGRHFVAFDYSYKTSGGSRDRDSTSSFSVVAMNLGCRIPRLQVRPQSAIGRLFADSFGTDYRIGDQAFDDAFHIATDSPELAHDVLHPGMRHLLLATRGRVVRFQDDSLLMFRSGHHSPEEIDAVLALMAQVLRTVPDHVWTRLRGEAPISDAPTWDAP